MRRWCCFLVILIFISGHIFCNGEGGWMPLFNGENLDGWQKLNGTAEYKIKDDMIVGVSKLNTPNTFLATEKVYSDFILEYEAQVDSGLNSGVQIRSLSDPQYRDGRVHGYQVEIDPSPRSWSGGLYDEARRGWLYPLEYNPQAKNAFKQGEWNHFRVEAIGDHIRVWLNDVPAVNLVDNMTPEGFIALQVHGIKEEELKGKTVKFRNIRIKTDDLQSFEKEMPESVPQVSYLTNQLTEREKADGWQLLWDGKTTKGWRSARFDTFPDNIWKIEHGKLIVTGSSDGRGRPEGDIVTREKYGDYIFEIDFKYTPGANSGIKYFIDADLESGNPPTIGCEYQILDDEKHPDAQKGVGGNRTLASLYDLIPADARYYAPHERQKRVNRDGWNRARIVVKGNHVEHYLNGIKVVAYERRTQMWRALVAYSKYAEWPDFGEREKGSILLQDHGFRVAFKNIKIKSLD